MHFGQIATNTDIALLNKPNRHTRNLVIEKKLHQIFKLEYFDNSYIYISQMAQCHISLNPFKHEMIIHIQIVLARSHGSHIQQIILN